ncbi:MAG: hypothetical protein FE048_00040 [Thermoplasmata archaeon]|nr:MAG: hypothetical protein FE048_00040 [Thermoplasmata archaeon]
MQNQTLPEAKSMKDLNKAGIIIAFVSGIIYFLQGIAPLKFLGKSDIYGIMFFMFFIRTLVLFIIGIGLIKINRMIYRGEFRKAKKRQLIWTILTFVLGMISLNLGAIIVGIITLLAYKRYGDIPQF